MISDEKLKHLALKVNKYWQSNYPESGNCSWGRACYMLGNIAAYELTEEKEFLDYAIKWAEDNNWSFYNDADFNTVNADYQLCGQTYFKLMDIKKGIGTDKNMLKTLEFNLSDDKCDYWWWIDAIHMALPFYNMLGTRFNDERYFEKAYKLYLNTRNERKLYDEAESLWYRDENFLPEVKREINGAKIFWGRGNGWVIAGLARALDEIDKDNKYYEFYKKDFCDMAKKLVTIQNDDGSFNVSFYDKETYPYHESSSTVLITLALFIGMRLGLIDDSYNAAAMKGFNWLTDVALDENGKIGWCQDIAGWPSHKVSKELSRDYVVGAYLMILNELKKTL